MALGRNAKIELLKRVPLFAGCTKKELEALAVIADELDLDEGTTLTKEGQTGREFFVLVDGTVCVTRGKDVVGELGAGAWFGEIALLARIPRTATVKSTSRVRVLVVTDRSFRQVVERTPSIAVKMLEELGGRLAQDAEPTN